MALVVDDDADCTAFGMVVRLQNQTKTGTQRINLESLYRKETILSSSKNRLNTTTTVICLGVSGLQYPVTL